MRIEKKSCLKYGLESDPETVEWWNRQNNKAKYEVLANPDRISLEDGLKKLSEFVIGSQSIWSQGSFDSVILENAYRACKIELPWKYWMIRDSRTLFDITRVDIRTIEYKPDMVHNALIDCYRQLIATVEAFEKIEN